MCAEHHPPSQQFHWRLLIASLFNKSLVWMCSPDRVNSSMRDAIMPECLDKAHWESWALTIPMNFNHSSLQKNFQFSPPDKRLFCDLSRQKAFLIFSPQCYCFCLYYCLYSVCGASPELLKKMLQWGFFGHIAGEHLAFDWTGRRSYMEACEKLHVVPSSAFLRQIQSNEMLLMHRCLGPQVSGDRVEAFSRVLPSWIQMVALARSNKYAQIVCLICFPFL